MSEILLQTIVEKLQAMELLLKNDKAGIDEETLKCIREEMQRLPITTISTDKFNELKLAIDECREKIERPLHNQTIHKHHLHKGMLISLVLFFTCMLFLWLCINTINDKEHFRENDIKYRVLKVTGNKALLNVLYHTDSIYNVDPHYMQQWVVQQEDLLVQQTKMLQLADEKKKEVKDLKGRAGKK